jgi:nucleotide-binding universal stress UspA family protein
VTPTTVVAGYDGSPDGERALAWAADVAAALGTGLRIVHAVGLLEHGGLSRSVVRAEDAVAVATRAGVAPADVEWRVEDGDPCSALSRAAEGSPPAAMIVVGSRGAGAHAGVLLGSTSLELAEHATVPVVVVPSGAVSPWASGR